MNRELNEKKKKTTCTRCAALQIVSIGMVNNQMVTRMNENEYIVCRPICCRSEMKKKIEEEDGIRVMCTFREQKKKKNRKQGDCRVN